MKIAIDGPSASGKSTIAKLLSQRLGIPYLETGLLYRLFGYIAYKRGTTELPLDELFKRISRLFLMWEKLKCIGREKGSLRN
jgi:cytidylate kinase